MWGLYATWLYPTWHTPQQPSTSLSHGITVFLWFCVQTVRDILCCIQLFWSRYTMTLELVINVLCTFLRQPCLGFLCLFWPGNMPPKAPRVCLFWPPREKLLNKVHSVRRRIWRCNRTNYPALPECLRADGCWDVSWELKKPNLYSRVTWFAGQLENRWFK